MIGDSILSEKKSNKYTKNRQKMARNSLTIFAFGVTVMAVLLQKSKCDEILK